MAKEEHKAVTEFLLKKSKEKDPDPERYVDKSNKEEIEQLVKKLKEKIKIEKD